jgi:hypothetical protein
MRIWNIPESREEQNFLYWMMKPSFTEALRSFESMRALMYAHNITKRDQANIVNIESLLFNLKWKGSTKQMKINDFLKKK